MNAEARFAALEAQSFRGRRNGGPTESSIGAIGQVVQIFRNHQLLGLLVRRDLKARYKDSALGFLWSLARPLTQLAIFYFIIGQVLGAARGIPSFAIYVYAGITAYGLFNEIVAGGSNSIIANSGLVKKVAVPREIYPLASVGGALFNFSIQLGVLVLATIALGQFPLTVDLLYAIPSILLIAVWGSAFALLLSAATVYLRDLSYLVEVVLMVLLWLTPTVYSYGAVRDALTSFSGGEVLLEIYTNNPIALGVIGLQRAFWSAGHDLDVWPHALLLRLGVAILAGLIFLVFTHWVFRRLQGNFAQEL